MSERETEDYRRHQLVAAFRDGKYAGVVWKGKAQLTSVGGTGIQDVLTKLRAYVDTTFVTLAKSRTSSPKVEEYVAAFRSVLSSLTAGHLDMIKAHYSAPGHRITSTQLAKAAKYENYNAANLQYGKVGKLLYEEIPMDVPIQNGDPIYTFMLATGNRSSPEEEWVWEMRPEVAVAVERLGLNN